MRRAPFFVALAVATFARVAIAADPTAEALFQEGMAAFDRGETDVACAKLGESQKLEPLPGTSYRLALCEEKRGRLASAWVAFEESLQRLAPHDDRRPLVEQRIAAIAPRLPRLVVVLAAGVKGDVTILRDAAPFGAASLGASLPVDPGEHVFEIVTPRHAKRTFTITMAEREQKTLTLELGPELPPEKVTPPPIGATHDEGAPRGLSAVTIAGFPVIGVGVAGMGAGVVLGFVAKGNYDDADARCPGGRCDATGFDDRTDARTLGDVGTGVFVGGAGVAAIGVVLCIVGAATHGESRDVATTFTPWVGDGVVGGGIRARF